MPQWTPEVSTPRRWKGTIAVKYLYTAGVAGERFFQTLRRQGRLAVTRCAECKITYLPPRIYCEQCFADLSEAWADVAPEGHVHSYTVVHVDHNGQRLQRPEVIAYIRIEGSDGGLVSRLLDIPPADVHADMPVAAVLATPRRRRGTLADIVGFAPRGQR